MTHGMDAFGVQAELVGVVVWAFAPCIDDATACDAEFAEFVLFGEDDVSVGAKSECIGSALLAALPQLVPHSLSGWVFVVQIIIGID